MEWGWKGKGKYRDKKEEENRKLDWRIEDYIKEWERYINERKEWKIIFKEGYERIEKWMNKNWK